jgi:hypothetical protein
MHTQSATLLQLPVVEGSQQHPLERMEITRKSERSDRTNRSPTTRLKAARTTTPSREAVRNQLEYFREKRDRIDEVIRILSRLASAR